MKLLLLSVKNKINKNTFSSNLLYYSLLIITALIWGLGQRPDSFSIIRFFGAVPLLFIILYRKNYLFEAAVFGFTAYFINFYWLGNTIVDFAEFKYFPRLIGLLILSGLCLLYCMQYVIISFVTRFFYKYNKKFLYFFPLIFVTVDFLFPKIFNHSIADGLIAYYYLIQIIDITGMTGVILAVLYSNLGLFYIVKKLILNRKLKFINFLFIIPIILFFIYGIIRVETLKKDMLNYEFTKASMIQGNITGKEKRDENKHQKNLNRYNSLTKQAEIQDSPEFIIWPESVFTTAYIGTDESLNRLLFDKYPPLVMGIVRFDNIDKENSVRYNSCLLVVNRKVMTNYDKKHLLVFGEYIPFEKYLPFINYFTPINSSTTPGNTPSVFKIGETVKACISICFEDLFPDEIRKKVNEGSNLMINITNDSWYGKGLGPQHHSAIARLRGIENRRSFYRCTPTGYTTASDYTGKIKIHGSIWQPEIITASLPLYDKRTVYSYIGELFSYLCILIACFMFLFILSFKLRTYISSCSIRKELNLQKGLGLKRRLGINKIKINLK